MNLLLAIRHFFQDADAFDWRAATGVARVDTSVGVIENGDGHGAECEAGRTRVPAAPTADRESLRLDAVALDLDVASRDHALQWAADHIGAAHALDTAAILRALERREHAGSTALGQGVAIPHARIDGIDRPLIVFIRCRQGIPFDAPDGRPVSTIVVILVPEAGDAEAHLRLLATIAALFIDQSLRTVLASAITAAEVAATFADGLSREAAPACG